MSVSRTSVDAFHSASVRGRSATWITVEKTPLARQRRTGRWPMLVAGGVSAPRDEELERTQRWLAALPASVENPGHRQLVQAFATWHVMRRLRRSATAGSRPRTYTAGARNTIKAAARLLSWLSSRGTTLPGCRQGDIDDWLATGPGACNVREFLTWAARRGYCARLDVLHRGRTPGRLSKAASAGTWHPGCCSAGTTFPSPARLATCCSS